MATFSKSCGKFRLELTEPWPMWVKITDAEDPSYDGEFPSHVQSDDLHDLKYLIERAIIAAQKKCPND